MKIKCTVRPHEWGSEIIGGKWKKNHKKSRNTDCQHSEQPCESSMLVKRVKSKFLS